jgi:hypothetical protein
MRSEALSPEQVARLYHGLRHKVAYFRLLTGRLHQTMTPHTDPLRVHADATAEHLEKLFAYVDELAKQKNAKLW